MMISIILPVCDAPIGSGKPHYWLRECLRSIENGGHDNFECLVGCDGDTPAIQAMVESLKDTRFRYFAFPRTRSVGNFQCHELLEKHAAGDLVMWMNHDDSYVDGALKIVADEAESLPGRAMFFRARLPSGLVVWFNKKPRQDRNVLVLATVTPRLPYIPPYGVGNRKDSEDLKWIVAVHDYYQEIDKPVIWVPTIIVEARPWSPPELVLPGFKYGDPDQIGL